MKTRIFILAFILIAAASLINAQPRIGVDINFGYFYQKPVAVRAMDSDR